MRKLIRRLFYGLLAAGVLILAIAIIGVLADGGYPSYDTAEQVRPPAESEGAPAPVVEQDLTEWCKTGSHRYVSICGDGKNLFNTKAYIEWLQHHPNDTIVLLECYARIGMGGNIKSGHTTTKMVNSCSTDVIVDAVFHEMQELVSAGLSKEVAAGKLPRPAISFFQMQRPRELDTVTASLIDSEIAHACEMAAEVQLAEMTQDDIRFLLPNNPLVLFNLECQQEIATLAAQEVRNHAAQNERRQLWNGK